MVPLQLKDGVHEPWDTEIARYLRRIFRDPAIFTYWHRKRGKLVIASWLSKGERLAVEHASIDNLNDPRQYSIVVDLLSWQRSPDVFYELKNARRALSAQAHSEEQAEDDEIAERADMVEWLRARSRTTMRDHWIWDTQFMPIMSY